MSGDDNNVKLNICFLFFFALHKIAFYFDEILTFTKFQQNIRSLFRRK